MERWAIRVPQGAVSTLDTGTGLSDTNFSMAPAGVVAQENGFSSGEQLLGHKAGILFKAADHTS